MVEPDGARDLVRRLVVLVSSENGDPLLWHTASRTEDGELTVWCSTGLDSLTFLGASWTAALPRLRGRSEPSAARAAADVECLAPARLGEGVA